MAKLRTPQPIAPASPAPQRQLSIAFESPVLQGMSAAEHAHVVTALASLLLQAAGMPEVAGADDDEL